MSSSFGNLLRFTIFGESHGEGIGVVLDGLPAGVRLDEDAILFQMKRRAPGRDAASTPRRESDLPHILSGVKNGATTGAPLCAFIQNTNTRSGDYDNLALCPRPSHADYTAFVRYNGYADMRGSGHFSGRLTAPLVFAGAVARQILARHGVTVGGHIASIGPLQDELFGADIPASLLEGLARQDFPLLNPGLEPDMRALILEAKREGDSVGGILETAAAGLPAGLGSPMFGGVENVLSALVFGIPAVKGVEFGAGFSITALRGSKANDAFYSEQGEIKTRTNHSGGIQGGITNAMPVVMRTAIKPTASIAREQESVNLQTGEPERLSVHGRHDPCIALRALPAVESAMCLGLLDLMMEAGNIERA